jgi:hypothetical protein
MVSMMNKARMLVVMICVAALALGFVGLGSFQVTSRSHAHRSNGRRIPAARITLGLKHCLDPGMVR